MPYIIIFYEITICGRPDPDSQNFGMNLEVLAALSRKEIN